MKQQSKLRLALVLTLVLSLLTVGLSQAQTFAPVKSGGGGFDVESGTATGQSVTVDGKTFDIFKTSKGSQYIKCKSAKSGRYYPVWLKQTS